MLLIGKDCGLNTLDEAYCNFMSHYDVFFLINNFSAQKAKFDKKIIEFGLTEIICGLIYCKKISIDEALAAINEFESNG